MVTVASDGGSIEFYTFGRDVPEGPSTSESDDIRLPNKVAQLRLPATNPGRALRQAYTHTGPFVARPAHGRPFGTAQDNRIYMFSLHYGDHSGVYAMFVHHRYFLSLLAQSLDATDAIVRDWNEWGPENTRFIDYLGNFVWLRYVDFRLASSNSLFIFRQQVYPWLSDRVPTA